MVCRLIIMMQLIVWPCYLLQYARLMSPWCLLLAQDMHDHCNLTGRGLNSGSTSLAFERAMPSQHLQV